MSRRKIVVDGKQYLYNIGEVFCVAKSVDTGKGYKISLAELTGYSHNEVERMKWKHTLHIRPADIAGWLQRVVN